MRILPLGHARPTRSPASARATASAARRSPVPGLLLLLLPLAAGCVPYFDAGRIATEAEVHPGDVVFQSVPGEAGRFIEGVTASPYSHCGLVVGPGHLRGHDGLAVVEAVEPQVVLTPLEAWIRRGRYRYVSVYRQRQAPPAGLESLIAAGVEHLGTPYDPRFRLGPEKLYCSELVWTAMRRAFGAPPCEPVPLRELPWRPWAEEIRRREGGPVPLDRTVITPGALAASEQLFLVYSNFPHEARKGMRLWGVSVGVQGGN
jgi:hypothetical protein